MKIEPRLSLLLSSLLVCLTHKVLRQQGTSPLSQSEGWPKKSVTHFHAGSINAHMSGNLTSDLTRARRNDPALLVLARFDEDVKWSFTANLPVLILNRGGAIGSPKDVRVEQKYSNVGREGFLYLEYILANYDKQNFPGVVGFCQADPVHFGNTREILLDDMERLKSFVVQTHTATPARNPRWTNVLKDIQADGFAYLGTDVLPASFGEPDQQRWGRFQTIFQTLLPGCNLADQFFTPGSCIAVTRQQILSNSKQWYEQWIRIGNDENRPDMCFTNERAWACVFAQKGAQCHCSKG